MNINLLQIVWNFIRIVGVSFVTFTQTAPVILLNNAEEIIIEYETIIQYDKKAPLNSITTLVEGKNGIITSKGEVVQEKVDKVIQVGTGKEGTFSGYLTEYGPDCHTCDGRGITYCITKEGNWHSIVSDGIYYNDYQYGEVRILAADHRQFPCGTIIEIHNSDLKVETGIVLDTGYGMKKAYNEGWLLVDLAVTTEKDITFGMNDKTKFYVKRWGW